VSLTKHLDIENHRWFSTYLSEHGFDDYSLSPCGFLLMVTPDTQTTIRDLIRILGELLRDEVESIGLIQEVVDYEPYFEEEYK